MVFKILKVSDCDFLKIHKDLPIFFTIFALNI